MKALTLQQPHAHLIFASVDELPFGVEPKRVENRKWMTNYHGQLLIHAGKGRAWLKTDGNYGIDESEMAFGAIIGVCKLVYVFRVSELEQVAKSFPWLVNHQHVYGPFCWILDHVRRFNVPIPYSGKQGLFNVPDDVVAEAIARARWEPIEAMRDGRIGI